MPKEKKIEEREREMEKKSSNEELQSVLEAIKSSDVSFFQSFQLQFQSSIFQILASHYRFLSLQSVKCLQIVLGFENYFISLFFVNVLK